MRRLLLGMLALTATHASIAHAEVTVIASELADSMLLVSDEFPSIADNGMVAFVGALGVSAPGERRYRHDVFFGDGSTPLRALGLDGKALDDVTSVAINDTQVALLARRAGTAESEVRGAYVATLAPGAPLTVLHEGTVLPEAGRGPTPWADIAMSPNGTIAFNALYDLYGSLYRKLPQGVLERLQTGPAELPSGLLIHRAYALDVNDDGRVVVDAELLCDEAPWCQGIQHGIYLLSMPAETTRDVVVAAPESCTSVTISRASTTVSSCYDELLLGDATSFTQVPMPVHLDAWPPTSGLRVDMNDAGQIAFAKSSGVYVLRADAARTEPEEPVMRVGELLGEDTVLEAKLGGLNGRGQLAVFVRVRLRDGREDRRILRVSGYVSYKPVGDLLRDIRAVRRRPQPPPPSAPAPMDPVEVPLPPKSPPPI